MNNKDRSLSPPSSPSSHRTNPNQQDQSPRKLPLHHHQWTTATNNYHSLDVLAADARDHGAVHESVGQLQQLRAVLLVGARLAALLAAVHAVACGGGLWWGLGKGTEDDAGVLVGWVGLCAIFLFKTQPQTHTDRPATSPVSQCNL